jgi:hypothetical protein
MVRASALKVIPAKIRLPRAAFAGGLELLRRKSELGEQAVEAAGAGGSGDARTRGATNIGTQRTENRLGHLNAPFLQNFLPQMMNTKLHRSDAKQNQNRESRQSDNVIAIFDCQLPIEGIAFTKAAPCSTLNSFVKTPK